MDNKRGSNWVHRLGLTAGLTAASLGMPGRVEAELGAPQPFVSVDEVDASRAIRDVFLAAPLKVSGRRIVINASPAALGDELHKALKSHRQDDLFRSAESIMAIAAHDTRLLEQQEKNLHAALAACFDAQSSKPATREQFKQFAAMMTGFYNQLASEIMPPLPEQEKRDCKAKPPQFIMCTPDDPKSEKMTASFRQNVRRHWKWNVVRETLEAAGGRVITLDGRKTDATQRQVFTNNPVYFAPHQNTAYVPLKNADERQLREQAALIGSFAKRGSKVVMVDANFNAGNMFYYPPLNVMFMGSVSSGKDVTPQDIAKFEEASGIKVELIPMSMQKEEEWTKKQFHGPESPYYDLDCFFAPLPCGRILYYPGGMTEEGEKKFKSRVGKDKLIAISREDAVHLAANLNAVEGADGKHTLIMPYCSAQLEKTLADLHYRVVTPEKLGLPEGSFQLTDGAVHCLAIPVGEDLPAKERQDMPVINLYHGDRRKRLEDYIAIETPDGKKSIMLGDLLPFLEKPRQHG